MDYFYVLGLNQRGEVLGSANVPGELRAMAIRWTPVTPNGATGTQMELTGLGPNSSVAAQNDSGQVYYRTSVEGSFTGVSIWTPSAPGSTSGQSVPLSGLSLFQLANNYGQVITRSSTVGGLSIWTPATPHGTTGAVVDLRLFVGTTLLNDYGQLFFANGPVGFQIFQPSQANVGTGTIIDVAVPPGTERLLAHAMNARGDVAGERCVTVPGAQCQLHGFVWRPTVSNGTAGTFTDVPPPAGYTDLIITGLNNQGEAVGRLSAGNRGSVPFIYTGGIVYEIPLPALPFSTTYFSSATINDFGQILVQPQNGQAFLLTPYTAPTADANAVSVTISTNTTEIVPFTVTGAGCQAGDYAAPQVLKWTPGANCTVDWQSVQTLGVARRITFTGWADGAVGKPRNIPTPATPRTFQALFKTEGFLRLDVYPSGSGTLSGPRWAQIGETVVVTATPNPGYKFLHWSSLNTNPRLVVTLTKFVDDSTLATANFARVGPAPSNYGITAFTGVPASKGALNNYGQILYEDGYPVQLRLWTPNQANGTSGVVTALTGIVAAGVNLGEAAINDRGTVVADMHMVSTPIHLWNPTTPNGTTGTYHTINPSVPFLLKGMNNYGQVFGLFNGAPGVWTPAVANGTSGNLRTDARFRAIDAWGPSGQVASIFSGSSSSVQLFTPTAPNAVTGGFSITEFEYYQQFRLGRFGPGGELVFSNCVVLDVNDRNCTWRPQIWRPQMADTLAGVKEDLPVLDGFSQLHPIFINARGEVLGTMNTLNRFAVPFLISNGKVYDLGMIPGLPASTVPAGLNDSGQILLSLSTNVTQMFLLSPAQPPVCMVDTVPYRLTVGPGPGQTQAAIRSAAGCVWNASSDSSWLTIVKASGQGRGSLQMNVASNDTGSAREAIVTINGFELHVTQAALPVVSITPPVLTFRSNGVSTSAPQEVEFKVDGAGSVVWYAPVGAGPLALPVGGAAAPGKMTISLPTGVSTERSRVSGSIPLMLSGADKPASGIPYVIDYVPSAGSSAPPFGSFDTPVNNATNLAGGVAVTGWALDDFEVDRVEIWRDRVGKEQVYPNGMVYIGVATFVQDARPDVEALHPQLLMSRRAGWGYMMLTNALPNPGGSPGNGTYTLEAIAVDREGNSASLGRRVITVNNAASKKPFGALDAPGAGATVSGSAYLSSGWVLTPRPAMIPRDGHTIRLEIDGVPQGPVSYNQLRTDVAGYFPNYINSDGAGGSLTIDTTKLSNGMHTIYWVAIDDQGNADGIGSRFFNTLNAGAAVAAEPEAPRTEAASVFDGDWLEAGPLGRVEFQLQGGGTDAEWDGALLVGGEKRPLPVGSTLNGRYGRFYWHPAPGFRGDYDLEFTNRATGATQRVTVRVGRAGLQREVR